MAAARDYWDGTDSGSMTCACWRECAERDYQGNPAFGPRPFCDTDRTRIGDAIRGMPETYAQLSLLLVPSGQQEEKVSGSREAPVPVNLDVETFMREIVHVTCSWEDQVRAAASLSVAEGGVRDGVALARACELLAGKNRDRPGYLTTLLSLEAEDKMRYVPATRTLADLPPNTSVYIDSAGDPWAKNAMDGTDAGLEFLRLNGRARGMLGLSLRRRKLPEVPCDGCSLRTLVQREALAGGWEPVARCTNCPQAYTGAQFELLMGRIYQAQTRALDTAS